MQGATVIIFCAEYLVALPALVMCAYVLHLSLRKQHRLAIDVTCSLVVAYAAAWVAGLVYYDPRPFVVDHITPLIQYGAYNGFPSGHTLFAAVLASVMLYYNRALGILLWCAAIIIGASRVVAGLHHPIDIIASICIALAAAFFVHRYAGTAVVKRFI